MITHICKIGNSQGVILDAAMMELAHLKVGDLVNVEVHPDGTITLTPIRSQIKPDQAAETARFLIQENAELFERLS